MNDDFINGLGLTEFMDALGGKVGGRRQADGTWTCACGRNVLTDLDLFMHRRYDHCEAVEEARGDG